DFVVEGLPFCGEDVGARDDDVDFVRTGFDGAADFFDALSERGEPGGEAGGDGGYANATAFEGAAGGFDEDVVDADGGDFDVERFDAEFCDEFVLEGLAGFGAETANAFVGVISGERRQIHARNGAEEPGGLVILFYGAACDDRLSAAFDGRGVDADVFDPVEIERDAAVGLQGAAAKVGEGGVVSGSRDFQAALVDAMYTAGIIGDVGHRGTLLGSKKKDVYRRKLNLTTLDGGLHRRVLWNCHSRSKSTRFKKDFCVPTAVVERAA